MLMAICLCFSLQILHILIAAQEVSDYRSLRNILSYERITMARAMCRDIEITDDIMLESQEEFRVWLQPRSAVGVDVQYVPRRTTVVIIDDDRPSKY